MTDNDSGPRDTTETPEHARRRFLLQDARVAARTLSDFSTLLRLQGFQTLASCVEQVTSNLSRGIDAVEKDQ